MKINKKAKRYTIFTALATTVASAAGMGTFYTWGTAAQVWELVTSGGLAFLSAKMLSSKGSHEGMSAAGGIVCAMATTTLAEAGVAGWAGGGEQTPVALICGGALYGALAWTWTRHVRWEKMEMKHRWVKIKNERYIGRANIENRELALQLKQLQLELKQSKLGRTESEPVFSSGPVGSIQRVVWKRYGVLVEPVLVATERGWVAETPLVGDLTINHMIKIQPDIEAALDLTGTLLVSGGASGGVVNLRYTEPVQLPDDIPYETFDVRSWDAPVFLGVDSRSNWVEIDLNVHMVVAGATGYGKSTLISSVVLQLAERECVRVVGVDMKPYAPEFSPLRPVLSDLVTNLVTAHEKLDWLIAEMYRRGKIMQHNGWKKWRPTAEDPVYFMIVDEYAELIRQDKSRKGKRSVKSGDSVQNKVETILAMSRAYGLILILCTQQPSAKLFGDDTSGRGNLPIRISFTMTEAIHDRYVLPSGGGWNTSLLEGVRGRFLLFSPVHREPDPCLALNVTDEKLALEVNRISAVLRERYPSVADVSKFDKTTPTRDEMPSAVLVQLALGPATKRQLAETLGVAADDWRLKKALTDLSQDREIQADSRNVWSLVD